MLESHGHVVALRLVDELSPAVKKKIENDFPYLSLGNFLVKKSLT